MSIFIWSYYITFYAPVTGGMVLMGLCFGAVDACVAQKSVNSMLLTLCEKFTKFTTLVDSETQIRF